MTAALHNELSTKQTLSTTLAPQMRQSVKMLAMSLPELRKELFREMSENPVIDDVESTLEKTTISDQQRKLTEETSRKEDEGFPSGEYERRDEAGRLSANDTEALERRQRFFDSQTREETLEDHLMAQLAFSDIEERDMPLAEILIGDLDDKGYFAGSIPDVMMVSGESEEKIRSVLAKIRELDPPGCGATNPKECLLAQLDKLDGSPYQEEVRELIEKHLEDIAHGKLAAIEKDLGIGHERYADVLKELRTLDPLPGRAFRKGVKGSEYVNPEVHIVKGENGWQAFVDERSLPEIRISAKYLKMLEDPATDKDTKSYIRERIASANAIKDAVARRQDTITRIAQEIVNAQPGFFEKGLKGLKPLTMQEIADKLGIHHTTVSRTVNDKYASTPKGVIELRKFFTSGFVTDTGDTITKDNVIQRLVDIIAHEDKRHPFSDEKLSELLKGEGFPVARRTVQKYRTHRGIPGASDRKQI